MDGGGIPPQSILHPVLMLYAELHFCVQEDPPDKRSEHSHTYVRKLVVLAVLIIVHAEAIGPMDKVC